MNEEDFKAHYIKRYTTTTRDSEFSVKLKNALDRNFTLTKPDAAWCSDIIYIWTQTGFVYLTSIMALYSKKSLVDIRYNLCGWVVSCIKKKK